MDTKQLPILRENGDDILGKFQDFIDISDLPQIQNTFNKLGFSRGAAVTGTFPSGYDPIVMQEKRIVGEKVGKAIQIWAEERKRKVEESCIFLSHRGINKPFIEKVDRALRMLSLKTWFDKDDLVAGEPLVRGVDAAFKKCSAAVFFISEDFLDVGVIGKEIEKALHESATRPGGFKV